MLSGSRFVRRLDLKTSKLLVILLVGLIVVLFAGMLGVLIGRFEPPEVQELEYKDLVSIQLSAVSVLLALVTIVISVFAIIGWGFLSEKATESAENHLKDGFKIGNHLHAELQKKVEQATLSHIKNMDEDDPLFKKIKEAVEKAKYADLESDDES